MRLSLLLVLVLLATAPAADLSINAGTIIYQKGGSPVILDPDAGVSNLPASLDGVTLGVSIGNGESTDTITVRPRTITFLAPPAAPGGPTLSDASVVLTIDQQVVVATYTAYDGTAMPTISSRSPSFGPSPSLPPTTSARPWASGPSPSASATG
jgi:hypothetical protein